MNRKILLMLGLVVIIAGCSKFVEGALLVTRDPAFQTLDESNFPIGFMGVYQGNPGGEAFLKVADHGLNVVHEFRSIQEISEAERYLEAADAAGLSVIQNMPTCRAYRASDTICEQYDVDVWQEAEWAAFISTLARQENLLAWFLPDEIDDYAAAADLYQWIHRYDPQNRPVFANPGTYRQRIINKFPRFSDFLWISAYPDFREEPRALVTYAMRRDAAAVDAYQANIRWGAILQFFDSADFGRSGGYPTAHQIRCDSYQAIIGGATGLWYFNYALGQDLTELLMGIEKVADEIIGTGSLEEVILSPGVPQTITRTVLSGPTQSPVVQGEVYDSIQTLQKEHQGTYLFAVNIATDTVVAEFGNLPARTEGVEVLFESRAIPISDGTFRDTFNEADVHIYQVVLAE